MGGVNGEGDVLTYVGSNSTAMSVSVTSHQELSIPHKTTYNTLILLSEAKHAERH